VEKLQRKFQSIHSKLVQQQLSEAPTSSALMDLTNVTLSLSDSMVGGPASSP
jgi:hypothetical protein